MDNSSEEFIVTAFMSNLTTVTVKATKPRLSFKTSAKTILGYTDLALFWLSILYTVFSSLLVSFSARKNVSGFFFVNRNVGFFPIACSMILSNIGSAHFIGMAGIASRTGLAGYAYELNGTLAYIILGWVFLPVYIASGSVTTIDYLKKRYGGRRIELYMAVMSEFLIIFTKTSVELYGLFKIMEIFFSHPDPHKLSLPFLVWSLMVACSGGLRSVVYSSCAQFVIIVVGAGFISYYSSATFDSYELLKEKFFQAWPNTTRIHFGEDTSYSYTYCGIPHPSSWNLIRDYNSYDIPWPGMVFGITICSIWYFCCDQLIVQSALGATSIIHAKSACILAGYVKITTVLFLVVPGLVARVLYADSVACAEPEICEKTCHSKYGCSNMAFPLLFLYIVPQNYRGVVLATVLLCGVTSLTASLHSGGSIFAFNIYKTFRENVSAMELLIMTKIFMTSMSFFSFAAVSFVGAAPSLMDLIQEITSALAPPIAAVYLCGIFWDRTTEKAAFRALLLGHSLAFVRLSWRFYYGSVVCGEESQSNVPHLLSRYHFLHYSIFIFVLCTSYLVISGIFSEPIGLVHLYRLTYWLRHSKLDRVDIDELDRAYDKLVGKGDGSKRDSLLSSSQDNACRFPIVGNMCCLATDTATHIINSNELREMVKANSNIEEQDSYSKTLNLHAIVLLLLSALLWGYFT